MGESIRGGWGRPKREYVRAEKGRERAPGPPIKAGGQGANGIGGDVSGIGGGAVEVWKERCDSFEADGPHGEMKEDFEGGWRIVMTSEADVTVQPEDGGQEERNAQDVVEVIGEEGDFGERCVLEVEAITEVEQEACEGKRVEAIAKRFGLHRQCPPVIGMA
jgi:hypothetical protein